MSNDKDKARVWALETSINKKIMDGTADAGEFADYLQAYLGRMPRWTEKDGIIRSKVVANGWSGPEWEKFYDKNRYGLSGDARKFLNSPDFKPTPAGTIVHFAVLKGGLFENNLRTTRNVCAKARKMKLKKASHDLICLIRREFTNEEIEKMGLWWIIGMSGSVDISVGDPRLLCARRDDSKSWVDAYYDESGNKWYHGHGFAFEESQIRPLAN